MTDDQTRDPASASTTTTKVRQGEASGRVSTVLAVSLVLAVIAAIVILGYFYMTRSPAAL